MFLESGDYVMYYEDEKGIIREVGIALSFPNNINKFLKTEYGKLFAVKSKKINIWLGETCDSN